MIPDRDVGSIIIVVATNAPLTSTQLDRLCKRATSDSAASAARRATGRATSSCRSRPRIRWPTILAFGRPGAAAAPESQVAHIDMLHNDAMDPLFLATIQATEESIVNALVGARTMTGRSGRTIEALPPDQLQALMRQKFAPNAW